MKSLYIVAMFFAALFLCNFTNAQNFHWAKQFGGASVPYCYSSAFDANGDIITIGYFNGTADFDPGAGTTNMTSQGQYDIFVSKLDASGNFLWVKQVGGTGEDWGLQHVLDNNGNIFLTGKFVGTVDFDPGSGIFNMSSSGSADIFVLKLDPTGNFEWAKTLGGPGEDYGNDISIDDIGNIYVTGYFSSLIDADPGAGIFNLTSNGNTDILVLKLNDSGSFIWAKNLGGATVDRGESIALDIDNNIYLTGYFGATADFDPGTGVTNLTDYGAFDVFVLKLDSSGSFVWVQQLGGTGADRARSISVDINKNIYVSGNFEGVADFDPGSVFNNLFSTGYADIFVSGLDSLGNFNWVYQMGSVMDDYGLSNAIDDSGNVYTTGTIDDTLVISKFDSTGIPVVTHKIGTGSTWILGNSITVNDAGDVVVSGAFNGSHDFDPGAGSFGMTATGSNPDGFILKLSDSPLGIAENTLPADEINTYPNPSNGEINIAAPVKIDRVTISNALGQLIYQELPNENKVKLQLFTNGIYFIQITMGNQTITKKVIVSK